MILFLSPHLDDAVLSCPGYIQRLVQQGNNVTVATVFSEADAEAAKLYRARRSEDRRAVRALGAEALHLGFFDAPYRSAKYRDFRGITFGKAREYRTTCRLVARRIAQLLADLEPAEVVSPMAVGNHVDHRLVRDAALTAVNSPILRFYEDRPYAFVREQVKHVLGICMAGQPARFWRRYFETTYVRSYWGNTRESTVMRSWAFVPPFPRYRLRKAFTVELTPAELEKTVSALQAYRTQINDLFANGSELTRLYRATPETLWSAGGPVMT